MLDSPKESQKHQLSKFRPHGLVATDFFNSLLVGQACGPNILSAYIIRGLVTAFRVFISGFSSVWRTGVGREPGHVTTLERECAAATSPGPRHGIPQTFIGKIDNPPAQNPPRDRSALQDRRKRRAMLAIQPRCVVRCPCSTNTPKPNLPRDLGVTRRINDGVEVLVDI